MEITVTGATHADLEVLEVGRKRANVGVGVEMIGAQ